MNLNNSPPFILEILPETYQQLKVIHTKYDSSSKYPANDNEYSQIFLQNLQARCKQTLKLFKVAKEGMFDEDSEYRHKLTRHTLVFNHILSELKAIFPNGKFIGDKYLITKKETAGEFWRNNFGSSVLVNWTSFYHALQTVHSIDSSFFSSNALKQTIDLTCDDYISIFEFDVFTRLFQPWTTLLKNWQILAVTHPGYKAFLTYDELKARLQKHIDKPGSYVYRLSCTRLGQWAIGYVTEEGQILQTIVQNISLSQDLTETKFYLYPDGKEEDHNLNILCSGMTTDEDRNVTVTEEQYEIYCGVGNSFQTCKICFENNKDIRVEPCNHLLCTYCLLAWQKSEGQGCPYCRTEIKETVQITMDLPRARN
jgi:E3 ubiquitin-protein ligase CBL